MLQPLLDRIEIIPVPAYLPVEKLKIAQKYLLPRFETEYGFLQQQEERISVTEAAIMKIVNNYCGHEAGVRNLRKCLDRIFRKIVARLEDKESTPKVIAEGAASPVEVTSSQENEETVTAPTVYKAELPERIVREYQVNTRNLEQFLDVPPTDD